MRGYSDKDRWQLTEQSFRCLLGALHREESYAIERYQRLHGRLILFFMRHRTSCPEDLADEVLNRLARKVSEGLAIESIEAYSLGIARMVAHEKQVQIQREQRMHREFVRNESTRDYTYYEGDAAFEAMEEQLIALPDATRSILARYHTGSGVSRIRERKRLANELGIGIGTLRKRIFDMQAQLRMKLISRLRHTRQDAKSKEPRYF